MFLVVWTFTYGVSMSYKQRRRDWSVSNWPSNYNNGSVDQTLLNTSPETVAAPCTRGKSTTLLGDSGQNALSSIFMYSFGSGRETIFLRWRWAKPTLWTGRNVCFIFYTLPKQRKRRIQKKNTHKKRRMTGSSHICIKHQLKGGKNDYVTSRIASFGSLS